MAIRLQALRSTSMMSSLRIMTERRQGVITNGG
jgi:hypothetical protein